MIKMVSAEDTDTRTKILINNRKIVFEKPLSNASGVHCIYRDDLNELSSCRSTGTFISKSCTLESRKGNPEPRYSSLGVSTNSSINSMGLPNMGYEYYYEFLKSYNNEKPYMISISGLSLNDNITILKKFEKLQIEKMQQEPSINSIIELNLSCPNVIGKPQIGYDLENLDYYLTEIIKNYSLEFGVKLPPYFDPVHFNYVADVINRFNQIKFVTCINSIGNGLHINTETETVSIKPKCGLGGIGGSVVLPTALANVHQFYKLLRSNKYVIGCGGIINGETAFQHILAGASLLQVGTQLYEEGIPCFKRIHNELLEIMRNKGYTNINQFRGSLKYIE